MTIRAEDFEYPDFNNPDARDRFNLFQAQVENLQETVGVDATIDLPEKDPWGYAEALLEIAVDGSDLDKASKAFLRSKKGKTVMEKAAERIVGSYFRRVEK